MDKAYYHCIMHTLSQISKSLKSQNSHHFCRFQKGRGGQGLALALGFCLSGFFVNQVHAQSLTGLDSLIVKRDSVEREIRRRVLSPEDKQNIRTCNQQKLAFLKNARSKNSEVAKVDSSLMAAKLKAISPDDPEAMQLMERKYSLEKSFEDAYIATAPGKGCIAGEDKRRKKGDEAVANDLYYQKLSRQISNRGKL
jgi:hypothetical protein